MKLFPLIAAVLAFSIPLPAQTGGLRGQVTDESGAVVPGAVVSLAGPAGLTRTANAGNDGSYSFPALPDGAYVVQASAPGLGLRQPAKVTVRACTQTLNTTLHV